MIIIIYCVHKNKQLKSKRKLICNSINFMKTNLLCHHLNEVIPPYNGAYLNFDWLKDKTWMMPKIQKIKFSILLDISQPSSLIINNISCFDLVIKDSASKVEIYVKFSLQTTKKTYIKSTTTVKNQLNPCFSDELHFKTTNIDLLSNLNVLTCEVFNYYNNEPIGQTEFFSLNFEDNVKHRCLDLIIMPIFDVKYLTNNNNNHHVLFCIGLSLQPKFDCININLLDLRILNNVKNDEQHSKLFYVQIGMFKNCKIFKQYSTKNVYATTTFSFRTTIKFNLYRDVDHFDLKNIDLVLRIMERHSDHNVERFRVLIGYHSYLESCKNHWQEIQNYPDNTIIKWHNIFSSKF